MSLTLVSSSDEDIGGGIQIESMAWAWFRSSLIQLCWVCTSAFSVVPPIKIVNTNIDISTDISSLCVKRFKFKFDSHNSSNLVTSSQISLTYRTITWSTHSNFRHCGLVVSAPAWDGTGCEFDSSVGYISHVNWAYDYLGPFGVLWVHMA